jgi:hypothetical protein
MLTADMNVRYWRELRYYYERKDVTTKIFLAATSSTTVATWGFWTEMSWLWKSLSAVSALLAVALPILNWSKKMADIADLHGAWVQIRNQYDSLWRRMQNYQFTESEAEAGYTTIQTKEAEVERSETKISAKRDAKLIEKCYTDVFRARNLPVT